MKKLILPVLMLLAAPAAHANNQISLDLDGDKKADTVALVDKGDKEFLSLQIQLSTRSEADTFDRFVLRAYDGSDEEVSPCMARSENILAKGPKNSFLFTTVNGGDEAGCNNESRETILVKVVKGNLRVLKVSQASKDYHSGDPSPYGEYVYDFVKRTLEASEGDMHSPEDPRSAKGRLPTSCEAPLLWNYATGGMPKCAEARMTILREKIYRPDEE